MELRGGPIFGSTFCEQFGLLYDDIDYDKRGANEKKEMQPQKIETREAQMNATKI